MIKTLPEIIAEIKACLTQSMEEAFDKLEQYLSNTSNQYNDFLHLKAMFKEAQKEELLGLQNDADTDITINRIRTAFLHLLDELKEDDIAAKEIIRKGQLLYYIPTLMSLQQAYKCLVRLAISKELILSNLTLDAAPETEAIRISKVMSVALIDISGNQHFSITAINSAEQYIEDDDYTEWTFYVTPLKNGTYPLLLKITTVQVINQKERKKELVLEKLVKIVATVVPEEEKPESLLHPYETPMLVNTPKPAVNPYIDILKESQTERPIVSLPNAPARGGATIDNLDKEVSVPKELEDAQSLLKRFWRATKGVLIRLIIYAVLLVLFIKFGLKRDVLEVLREWWQKIQEVIQAIPK